MTLLNKYRQWRARRELQRMVEQRRNSYETRRYRERRAAALKHFRRPQAT
jgi:hypothetical protein